MSYSPVAEEPPTTFYLNYCVGSTPTSMHLVSVLLTAVFFPTFIAPNDVAYAYTKEGLSV